MKSTSQRKYKEKSKRQPSSTPNKRLTRLSYGGQEVRGHRKIERPFIPGAPLAFEFQALQHTGKYSLVHRSNISRIKGRVFRLSNRYHVRIRDFQIHSGRIAIVFTAKDRYAMTCFLRVMAGQVAQMITGARKGVKKGKYWARLCWSKLILSKKSYEQAVEWLSSTKPSNQSQNALSFLSNPLSLPTPEPP